MAIERVVVSEEVPHVIRAYAWLKLLRHWTALRWDDTTGIRPSLFQRRARGLFMRLERSKTSGPDKAIKILPVFVSTDAFVE